MLVTCPNQQCDWSNSLSELPEHYKNCKFTELPKWVEESKNIIEIDDPVISNAHFTRPKTARLNILPLDSEIHHGSFSELTQHDLSPTNVFERLLLMPTQERTRSESKLYDVQLHAYYYRYS